MKRFLILAVFMLFPALASGQTSQIPQQCVGSSSTTAETCTTLLVVAAKDVFVFTPGATNTGAFTLAINGGSAMPVQKWLGTALVAGDLVSGKPLLASTDGTNVYVMTIGNAPSGGGGSGTVTHTTGNLVQGESVVGSGASVSDVATSSAYLDCSQFSGADWGLIAQSCLSALQGLNSIGGIADMRGVSNATTASVNPLAQSATLPASGVMLLGAGTWLTNVPIAVHNDWSIQGINVRGVNGQVGTTIKAGASFQATYNTGTITVGTTGANEVITGSGTTWTSSMVGCAFVSPGGSSTANNTFGIITAVNSATSISLGWGANNGSGAPAASAYDIYCPIYAAGSGGASSNGDQFGMNLTNINLDCNNVAGCVGYMNWYGNQGTRAFNVGLHGYTNIGADYEFQAQNFDESSFGAMTPGTSCTTSTIPLVVRLGAESTSGFATLSMNQCPGTVPAVGIDDQTNGLVIRNADLEHVGIGVLIGGNVTCPVACPIGPKVNVQGGVFVNVHCLTGVTTCGQISSAEGTPKNLTFIDMQATSTNMLIDGPNGNTITAGGSETTLGLYQTGEAGVVVASTSVQANAQPKTLPADAVLIANLPTAATSATAVAVVSNGSTSTDCTTGGGSNYVTCYNTGSAWVPVGGGSGSGLSGQTTGCVPLAASATTSTSSASVCDNGTTVSTTEPMAVGASLSTTADGTHPSTMSFVGNTTLPSCTTNIFCFFGPPAATFTAFSFQAPSAIPGNNHLLGCTVSGTNCLLTDEGAIPTGTVTTFSAGNLSPLFTTSVATATSTPALTFTLSNAAQNSVLAGPATGGAGAPSYQTAPTISAANMTSFPTLNQSTTGAAAALSVSGQTGLITLTGITSTNRIKTVRDAADTLLELGGSYTPTGTWTNMTLVTPALGTPSAAILTNATGLPGAGIVSSSVTAAQLAAQYSKGSCTELWGGSGTSFALTSGDDAIMDNGCYNDSGVTRTITAVKCRSDNASNTTTVNPTFGSAGTGTTILSGALTCGNSLAYSSTGTVSNASWTTGTGINPVMGGTLTGTSIAMIVEYTF